MGSCKFDMQIGCLRATMRCSAVQYLMVLNLLSVHMCVSACGCGVDSTINGVTLVKTWAQCLTWTSCKSESRWAIQNFDSIFRWVFFLFLRGYCRVAVAKSNCHTHTHTRAYHCSGLYRPRPLHASELDRQSSAKRR